MRLKQFLIAGAVLVLDEVTKQIVAGRFTAETAIPVIPGFFRLVLVENTGMAFGLFDDSPSTLAFAAITLVSAAILGLVIYLIWTNQFSTLLGGIGIAVVLGGAAGNVFDRLVRGKVIDFLDFYVGSTHWPSFNVADIAIVVGAGLLMVDLMRGRRESMGT